MKIEMKITILTMTLKVSYHKESDNPGESSVNELFQKSPGSSNQRSLRKQPENKSRIGQSSILVDPSASCVSALRPKLLVSFASYIFVGGTLPEVKWSERFHLPEFLQGPST